VSQAVPDPVLELLARSLAAWGIAGEVQREGSGGVRLEAAGRTLRVARAAPDLPFRWTVAENGRTRGCMGIPGLLRTVRSGLDPAWRPVRLRIAPLPLVPP